MKVYYYITYVLSVILALPFVYAGSYTIYRRIFKTGLYEHSFDLKTLAVIWGVSPATALVISQFIAAIFFLSLLFILLSIIIRRWVNKDKITVIVLFLFLLLVLILCDIPIILFK